MNENTQNKAAACTKLVRAMRSHWQREADAGEGDPAAARREKERGDHLFEELMEAITGSLCKLAYAYLHDTGLIEDGVRELTVVLYQKLRDLSGSPSAQGWENPKTFWTCLDRSTKNLFLRHVQRAYGRKLTEKTTTAESETEADPVEAAADPDAESPLRALLEDDALRSLLVAIPDERYRLALILDVMGTPHEEIARRLGVKSLKTVYNYIERAKRDALAWTRQRYELHGEFGDWFGHDRSSSPAARASTVGPLPKRDADAQYREGRQ